jgi:predicted transcriptional regulator
MANEPHITDKAAAASAELLNFLENVKGTDTKPAVVNAVKALISNPSLSSEDKQQAFMEVTRAVVAKGCDAAMSDTGTLLRGKDANTQFLAAYMEQYAQDYKAAVMQETATKLSALNIPKSGFTTQAHPSSKLDTQNIPLPGERTEVAVDENIRKTISPNTEQEWDDLYSTAAKIIVDANNNQLRALSPEAQEFLKTCSEVAQEKFHGRPDVDKIVATLTANNCNLRLTGPAVATMKTNSQDPLETAVRNIVTTRGAQIAQAYINKFDAESVKVTRVSENILAKIREDSDLREKTLEASIAASSGQAETYQPKQLNLTQLPVADLEPEIEQPALQPHIENEVVIENEPSKKSKLGSVGATLRVAANSVKNAALEALERKGAEESLKKVQTENPKLVEEFKELQKKMSNLKRDYLNAVDTTKSPGGSVIDIEKNKKEIGELQKQMDDMKAAHKGLAQLDRSKVGQVIHSKVRDVAKAVGSKLSHH